MSVNTLSAKNISFLETVMKQGKLNDIYEARDLTEVVFRTMRDVMPNSAVDSVTSELQKDENLSQLWQDTNPLVSWLSRLRSPLNIEDKTFIRRIEQEGGMPETTDGETVIKAVFNATKQELSRERIQEIAQFLPGMVQKLWQSA